MKKVTLLIPKNYNDGQPIDKAIFKKAICDISAISGGCTIDGEVFGNYLNSQGVLQHETTIKVWVVVEDHFVKMLYDIAKNLQVDLKQECLYFEITDANVTFIK